MKAGLPFEKRAGGMKAGREPGGYSIKKSL
jgi:hypothetical protein